MAAMNLRRLWQPRSGLFWQMLAFNVLSSISAWALRALDLTTFGTLLLGSLGLANVVFGLLAAWRLLHSEPAQARPQSPTRPRTGVDLDRSVAAKDRD